MARLPTLFAAHGGGPLPVLGDKMHMTLTSWLKSYGKTLPIKPSGILVVSAHYEEPNPTITSGSNPPLIYDYYGFPPESYELKYPAPGSPSLADKTADLLRHASFKPKLDPTRGFDHGVFIPLMLSFPEADIPVVTLSVLSSLDPEQHIKMGEALAPLRDQGVLIFASGLSFHNLPAMMTNMRSGVYGDVDPKSKAFDDFLKGVLTDANLSYAEKKEKMKNWTQAPSARFAHPREEHLIPLFVAFGAGNGDNGEAVYSDNLGGFAVSSFQFGSAA